MKLIGEGETVHVDYPAARCLTCKTNEANAPNTKSTREHGDELGVTPHYADFTSFSPEIQRWLDKFKSISVPLTVIVPGKSPERPIVIRDLCAQSEVLKRLREAGPSKGFGKAARAAETAPK